MITKYYWCDQIKEDRWAWHVTRVGDMKDVYGILLGKPERRDYLEDLGVVGRIHLKWILKKCEVRV
jgi:hypothetical protein